MPSDLNEAIARLRRLSTPVPRPRRLPTESEVRDAETNLGVSFHPDLRRYLLEASDVVYGTHEPVTISGGHTAIETVVHSARDLGVPDGLLPICDDNADYFCITANGDIVYWSHNGATNETWPNLATWITDVWIGGG
ncbi:MAG: SMI1/KNR4 family protein [Ilumatobacter fluminis]|uniref:SMI1/KNR4 family protein n=1 Tax=Ilumatobacter fluminis TaxID=467091 RepID=UPI0032ECDEDA